MKYYENTNLSKFTNLLLFVSLDYCSFQVRSYSYSKLNEYISLPIDFVWLNRFASFFLKFSAKKSILNEISRRDSKWWTRSMNFYERGEFRFILTAIDIFLSHKEKKKFFFQVI